jgi:perosamine synthetase
MKKATSSKEQSFIPVSRAVLNKKGRKYLLDAYDTGWISSGGKYIEKFEKAFAEWNDIKHGAASSSGTNALILGLRGLGIKEGDEVIVPEFTMIASSWAVMIVGAKPVFVDCDNNLLIDVSKIEKAITPNTRAIMPVHIYGRSCDMDSILKIAKKHKLKVIEDSAESHGIKPRGDVACYSLFGNKIITSGEGGICLTNNEKMAKRIKWLRSMAFNPEHTFLHEELGYNFRMTNLQAAVALSQVEDLDIILKKRQQLEKAYDKGLASLYGTHLVKLKKRDVLWMYDIVLVDPKKRDKLRKFLLARGVDTRVFFKPMSQQSMHFSEGYKNLNAFDFSLSGLYLPTTSNLSKKEIDKVVSDVIDFFNGCKI